MPEVLIFNTYCANLGKCVLMLREGLSCLRYICDHRRRRYVTELAFARRIRVSAGLARGLHR